MGVAHFLFTVLMSRVGLWCCWLWSAFVDWCSHRFRWGEQKSITNKSSNLLDNEMEAELDDFHTDYDSTWEDDDDVTDLEGVSFQRRRSTKRNERAAKDMQNFRHMLRDVNEKIQKSQNGVTVNISENQEKKKLPNLLFYQNRKPSKPDGVYIEEFHKKWFGKYERLEYTHSFIQWLFPIQEKGMNWDSHILTAEEIKLFREDEKVKNRLLESYKLMLDFYGIELLDVTTGKVGCAKNCQQQFVNLDRHSHNNLRITRILKCLGILGFQHYQAPLVKFFLHQTLVEGKLPSVKQSVLDYFLFSVVDKDQRKNLIKYAFQNFLPREEFEWCPKKIQRRFLKEIKNSERTINIDSYDLEAEIATEAEEKMINQPANGGASGDSTSSVFREKDDKNKHEIENLEVTDQDQNNGEQTGTMTENRYLDNSESGNKETQFKNDEASGDSTSTSSDQDVTSNEKQKNLTKHPENEGASGDPTPKSWDENDPSNKEGDTNNCGPGKVVAMNPGKNEEEMQTENSGETQNSDLHNSEAIIATKAEEKLINQPANGGASSDSTSSVFQDYPTKKKDDKNKHKTENLEVTGQDQNNGEQTGTMTENRYLDNSESGNKETQFKNDKASGDSTSTSSDQDVTSNEKQKNLTKHPENEGASGEPTPVCAVKNDPSNKEGDTSKNRTGQVVVVNSKQSNGEQTGPKTEDNRDKSESDTEEKQSENEGASGDPTPISCDQNDPSNKKVDTNECRTGKVVDMNPGKNQEEMQTENSGKTQPKNESGDSTPKGANQNGPNIDPDQNLDMETGPIIEKSHSDHSESETEPERKPT